MKVSVVIFSQLKHDGPLVSMVDGELFEKLDKIGCTVRGKHDEPFGGIQVDMDVSVLEHPRLNAVI
jgi:hypothetical protein